LSIANVPKGEGTGRVQDRNHVLVLWLELDREHALLRGRELQQRRRLGLLHAPQQHAPGNVARGQTGLPAPVEAAAVVALGPPHHDHVGRVPVERLCDLQRLDVHHDHQVLAAVGEQPVRSPVDAASVVAVELAREGALGDPRNVVVARRR